MTKLPALTGKEIVSLLKKIGLYYREANRTFIKDFKRCRNDKGGFPENS